MPFYTQPESNGAHHWRAGLIILKAEIPWRLLWLMTLIVGTSGVIFVKLEGSIVDIPIPP